MTLKEKFSDICEVRNHNHFDILTDKLEQIADDFAIGFNKYIDLKYYQHEYDNNKYAMAKEDFTYGITYTIEELLQIYKKEKGL